MNRSKEISIYLDRLRYNQKLTQLNFIDNVVSLRQYRRYLNGESEIPYKAIDRLSQRLGYRPEAIIHDYEFERANESKKINVLYNLVANKDLKNAALVFSQIDSKHILNPDNELIYKHTKNLFDNYRLKDDEETTINKTLNLVNLDHFMDSDIITFAELLIITSLLSYRGFEQKDLLAKKLKFLLDNPHALVTGNSDKSIINTLQRLARYEGMMGHYEEVIKYCSKGIEISKQQKSYFLLEYFYYFSALAYYRLNETNAYESALYNLYISLLLDNNLAKIKKFEEMVKEDFAIDLLDFYKSYLKKVLN